MKKKPDLVRKGDALKYLDLANRARTVAEANAWALVARMEYRFGQINENCFGVRDDRRRGHPRIDHKGERALMVDAAKKTGETRPYVLADMLIDSGAVALNGTSRATVRRRLAEAIAKMK